MQNEQWRCQMHARSGVYAGQKLLKFIFSISMSWLSSLTGVSKEGGAGDDVVMERGTWGLQVQQVQASHIRCFAHVIFT